MKTRTLCHALWLTLAAVSFGSCSSSHMQAGTDGVTHWLTDCETSAECGELSCLCGVCTRSCEASAQCSDLGADARCIAPHGDRCAEEVLICQLDAVAPGGAGGREGHDAATLPMQDGGRAVVPGDNGPAEPGRDGGVEDGALPPDPERCRALDARSSGALCARLDGYTWTGSACEPIYCGCSGSECDEAHESLGECERSHAACYDPVDFPAGVEVVALWRTYDPSSGYEPQVVSISGALASFVLEPPLEPSSDGRYAIEDPELGEQTDPNAPRVAMAGIFVVAAGAIDSTPDGVIALDRDKVLGQARGALLFWTPVDLLDSRGVRGFDPAQPIGPLSAGYHLFLYGEEVPLTTELTMGTTISD